MNNDATGSIARRNRDTQFARARLPGGDNGFFIRSLLSFVLNRLLNECAVDDSGEYGRAVGSLAVYGLWSGLTATGTSFRSESSTLNVFIGDDIGGSATLCL